MSLNATRSRLNALTRDLHARWQETREVWVDTKRDEFEATYLTGLFAAVERAGNALEQLEEIAAKARRDCE